MKKFIFFFSVFFLLGWCSMVPVEESSYYSNKLLIDEGLDESEEIIIDDEDFYENDELSEDYELSDNEEENLDWDVVIDVL